MTAMGGGAVVLTAEVVARAVIAAAASYGDDPVKAMTCARNAITRRTLGAAFGGLQLATEVPLGEFRCGLPVKASTVYTARSQRKPEFLAAQVAAMRAAEFALAELEPEDEDDAPEDEPDDAAAPAEMVAVECGGCAPPVFVGPVLSRPEGQALGRIRPPQPMRPLAPPSERGVRELVLEALEQKGAMDSMNLATAIDRKEMVVVSALANLEHEGLAAYEVIEDGPRRFKWRAVA